MAIPKFWSVDYYDSGAGAWIHDTQIPRAGLDNFVRTKEATIDFVTLADGSEAKTSGETKSVWQDIDLTFPQQVVTNSLRTQLLKYIDNEYGVRIPIPIVTGASAYVETVLQGYMTNYKEEWIAGGREQQFQLTVTIHEFNVEGA